MARRTQHEKLVRKSLSIARSKKFAPYALSIDAGRKAHWARGSYARIAADRPHDDLRQGRGELRSPRGIRAARIWKS